MSDVEKTGCDGTLKIVEITEHLLYCRYLCNKCAFDGWHTTRAAADMKHQQTETTKTD